MKLIYALILTVFFPVLSFADTFDIEISNARAFSTIEKARSAAIFFDIKNNGNTYATLLKVEVDENIAKKAELHNNYLSDNGVISMRQIDQIRVEPGKSASLEPSGKHVMLLNLEQGLASGTEIPLTLIFQHNKKKTIAVPVIKPGKKLDTADHSHHHH